MEQNDSPPDTFEDIAEWARPVVVKHGRILFQAVTQAGVATGALGVLVALVRKHQSQHSADAIVKLTGSVQTLVNLLMHQGNYTPEMAAQCDKDLQEAWAAQERSPILRIH